MPARVGSFKESSTAATEFERMNSGNRAVGGKHPSNAKLNAKSVARENGGLWRAFVFFNGP